MKATKISGSRNGLTDLTPHGKPMPSTATLRFAKRIFPALIL